MRTVNPMLDEILRRDLEELERPWTQFLRGEGEVPQLPEKPTVAQLLLYIACAARTQLLLTASQLQPKADGPPPADPGEPLS